MEVTKRDDYGIRKGTATVSSRKKSLKERIITILKRSRSKKFNTVDNPKLQSKRVKKLTWLEQRLAKQQRNNVILGIGLLLVVVSIAYSTSVIIISVDSSVSRVLLCPQIIFALYLIFKAFSKFYK